MEPKGAPPPRTDRLLVLGVPAQVPGSHSPYKTGWYTQVERYLSSIEDVDNLALSSSPLVLQHCPIPREASGVRSDAYGLRIRAVPLVSFRNMPGRERLALEHISLIP